MNAQAFEPEKSVGYWINRVSRRILRRHDTKLKPLGLVMGHLPVLLALENGRAQTQKELALHAQVEQPTMAELLGRMERDALVERTPNPSDKRGSLVSLARAVRARIPRAKAALLENERDATAGFSAAEKAQLIALLRRVAANLEE